MMHVSQDSRVQASTAAAAVMHACTWHCSRARVERAGTAGGMWGAPGGPPIRPAERVSLMICEMWAWTSLDFEEIGELAQMVERSLSMREVRGSIPLFSILSFCLCTIFLFLEYARFPLPFSMSPFPAKFLSVPCLWTREVLHHVNIKLLTSLYGG